MARRCDDEGEGDVSAHDLLLWCRISAWAVFTPHDNYHVLEDFLDALVEDGDVQQKRMERYLFHERIRERRKRMGRLPGSASADFGPPPIDLRQKTARTTLKRRR
ncbi:hypothetical protein CFI11_19520 [Thalassococcus sp. S3]|nr:hypothetical protein CFI11_19520 [Thalassococcus sp. S3]